MTRRSIVGLFGTPKKHFLALSLTLIALLSGSASRAQLNAPNEMGVSMSAVYLNVQDVERAKTFYVEYLGGEAIKVGNTDVIRFPDVLFFLARAEPTGGTEGSTIDHIGFLARDAEGLAAELEAKGAKLTRGRNGAFVFAPDGLKIEINYIPEETGPAGWVAGLRAPLQFTQLHYFVNGPYPGGGVASAQLQAWYGRLFGARNVPTVVSSNAPPRAGFEMSNSLLGTTVELRFTQAPTPTVPTKGRALDHIGFEIKNLELFTKGLEAQGIKLDIPYRKHGDLGTAFLTDPMGTSIELTEGLDRLYSR